MLNQPDGQGYQNGVGPMYVYFSISRFASCRGYLALSPHGFPFRVEHPMNANAHLTHQEWLTEPATISETSGSRNPSLPHCFKEVSHLPGCRLVNLSNVSRLTPSPRGCQNCEFESSALAFYNSQTCRSSRSTAMRLLEVATAPICVGVVSGGEGHLQSSTRGSAEQRRHPNTLPSYNFKKLSWLHAKPI